jgi:hypothetical protein
MSEYNRPIICWTETQATRLAAMLIIKSIPFLYEGPQSKTCGFLFLTKPEHYSTATEEAVRLA